MEVNYSGKNIFNRVIVHIFCSNQIKVYDYDYDSINSKIPFTKLFQEYFSLS